MKVVVANLTKRFENDWIVKDFNYVFEKNSLTAIIGPNGSGKSTLLKMLGGLMLPNKGEITYLDDSEIRIDPENCFWHLTFCSPAQQLIEEFALKEMLQFHFKFRSPVDGENIESIIDKLKFRNDQNKLIKNFSSGMKQRLKLGLALFTASDIVLLDEPTTNMDDQTVDWYSNNIIKLLGERSVIISSNQKFEYSFCQNHIQLMDYKPD